MCGWGFTYMLHDDGSPDLVGWLSIFIFDLRRVGPEVGFGAFSHLDRD